MKRIQGVIDRNYFNKLPIDSKVIVLMVFAAIMKEIKNDKKTMEVRR